ncbi:DNA polymerase domain-containing protein [Gordonia sp. (in: high G+C Gram-positive bacteria)]|uniref:DNA polymerase domain-containing protein n=1 Tax=Gordonia sp. (in: high G+C Gram-positive bacteria) TaxID=84139 RepID=UPI003528C2D4
MPKPKPEMLDVDGVEVKLSNPDKIYFPELGEAGGRKRDLVEYYRTVALQGALMTAIAGRPTYLERYPDGVDGDQIYQKHLTKYHPAHVESTEVVFPSKRTGQAFCPRIPADAVWAANLGTLTFHTWPTLAPGAKRAGDMSSVAPGARRAGDLSPSPDNDHPDQLRLDLDPSGDTTYADARRVALELLRPLLDELGLPGFPKTSGKRGVHVYIPIEPGWDFIATRRAVIALARELERRDPAAVTTSWWKEERGDRVFIDFNQNARDRSMASPYSVRKTPRAQVSTPLTWDELADAEPADFTVSTVPELLARRGDPWTDIDARSVGIEVLLEMVQRDDAAGLGDMPYPPSYPKMPGEPPRVQPSKKVAEHWDAAGNRIE